MSQTKKAPLRKFLLINGGIIMVALGIHLFKVPNHFVTGGVSGLSIIASAMYPGLSVGPFMAIINLVLVGLAFAMLGKSFGFWTVYGSFALSGYVWILGLLFPLAAPLSNDTLLELIYSILLPGFGSAIVFNLGGSTGGTDIVAKILSSKTSVNIGTTLLVSDFLIAAGAGLVFGVQVALYSMLGLILKAFIIDMALEGFNVHKKVEILTVAHNEVERYIAEALKREALVYLSTSVLHKDSHRVIHAVLSRREALALRQFVRHADPGAMINISSTSEIIGKGYRNSGN